MKKLLLRLCSSACFAVLFCCLFAARAQAANGEFFMTGYPMWTEEDTVFATDGDPDTCGWGEPAEDENRSFGLRFEEPVTVSGFRVLTGRKFDEGALGEAELQYRCAGETEYRTPEDGAFTGSRIWSFASQPLLDVVELRVRVFSPPIEEEEGLFVREIGCFAPEPEDCGAESVVILDGLEPSFGTPEALTDGDPYSYFQLTSPGVQHVAAGASVTLDFGRLTEIGWIRAAQGYLEDEAHRMAAALEYSADGVSYTPLAEPADDWLDLGASPVHARYLRLRCCADSEWPVVLRSFAAGHSADSLPLETDAEALGGLRFRYTESEAVLEPHCPVTLRPGESLGLALPDIRMVTDCALIAEGELPACYAGFHPLEIGAVPAAPYPARCFRLVNDGETDRTFTLHKLRLTFGGSAALEGPPATDGHPLSAFLESGDAAYYEPQASEGTLLLRCSDTTDATRALTVEVERGGAQIVAAARAAGDDTFRTLGAIEDHPTRFDLSTLPAVAELRLTWIGGAPKFYSAAFGETPCAADRSALQAAIARAEQAANASALSGPLAVAREALENPFLTQPAVDRAAQALLRALNPPSSGHGSPAPTKPTGSSQPSRPAPAPVEVPSGGAVTLRFAPERPTRVAIPLARPSASLAVYRVNPDGTETLLRDAAYANGSILVALDGASVLRLRENARPFADEPADQAYAEAVRFAASRELFIGTDAQTFSPQEALTHAMLVTVLHRLAGEPAPAAPMPENGPATYYENAVAWAAEHALMERNLFSPDTEVTAQTIALVFSRFAAAPATGEEAFSWAAAHQILPEDTPPDSVLSRAETARALQQFVAYLTEV